MLIHLRMSLLNVSDPPQDSEYCERLVDDEAFDAMHNMEEINFDINGEDGVVFMGAEEMKNKITTISRGKIDKHVRMEIQHWLTAARKVKNNKESEAKQIEKEKKELAEQEKKDHVGIIKELGIQHCRRNSWCAYGMLHFDGYAFANGTADYVFEDEVDETEVLCLSISRFLAYVIIYGLARHGLTLDRTHIGLLWGVGRPPLQPDCCRGYVQPQGLYNGEGC